MPKVPVVNAPTINPSATPRGQINANVSPEQFGAGIARGLNTVAQQQIKMKQEDDAVAATDAFNRASEDSRLYLYEGKDAVYSQQGKMAVGSHDNSKKFFEDTNRKYSEKLKNDTQRKAFSSLWNRKTNSTLDSVARHEAKQRKVYFEATQVSNIEANANSAANNYDKPNEIQQSLDNVDVIIRSNPMGSSEEVVAQKQASARSAIHKSVIDRMMIDNPDLASKYYDTNKKSIDGVHHKQIESALKGNKQKRQAQINSDKINLSSMTDDAKRAKAKKENNPEVRALTEGLVNQDIARRKTDRIENEREMKEAFWNVFLKNPDINNIPEALPADVKLQAMKYAANPVRKTDLKTWNEINRISISDPDKFSQLNLLDYVNELDESDFQAFGKLQRTIKTGDKQTLTHVQSISSKATKALKAIGYKLDSDTGQVFMRKFQDEVSALEQNEKRRIRPEEVDSVIDKLLLKGEVDDGNTFGINFVDPDKLLFEVEEGEKFFIQDIPKKERSKIIDSYERMKGITPTEEQIVDLYTKKKTKR